VNPSTKPKSKSLDAPLIVEVRRGSQHDGPGLRSVVFFKGCHLRCSFCQNPETQSPGHEIASQGARCVRCGSCLHACPNGAIEPGLDARLRRDQCQCCGACTRVCPSGALRFVGYSLLPPALAEILLRDAAYYHRSGGGVTLSGGECLLYPEYLADLIGHLKIPTTLLPNGASVAIQTGGEFPFEPALAVLGRVELVQFDLKFADPNLCLAHTGRDNQRILDNLERLLELDGPRVQIRVPLIPGVTATEENFCGLACLLRKLAVHEATLLPYNPLGLDSAHALGRDAPRLPARFTSPEEHERMVQLFNAILGESAPLMTRGF
jgi:pyruvate formate lyase activating enzyme